MLSKRIYNLSKNIKSLVVLSQSKVIYHCQRYEHYSATQILSRSTNFNNTNNETTFDSTSTQINNSDLLELDDKNINGNTIVTQFQNLLLWQRKNSLELKKVHNESSFKNLCTFVDENIEKLHIIEVVKILKVLVDLRIPRDSKLIASLMKKIESNINSLPFKYFTYLADLIIKMEPTPLSEKMSKNLNRLFVMKINTCFERNTTDMNFLIDGLSYACKYFPNKKYVYQILEKLEKCDMDGLSGNEAFAILKSIYTLDEIPSETQNAIHKIQTILMNNLDNVKKHNIIFFLNILSHKSLRRSKYYNGALVDKIVEKIIKENVNFNDAISCISSLNRINHVNKNILSYSSAIFYEQHEMNKSKILYDFNQLLVLLNGLAFMRFKPIFWDALYKYYQNGEILEYNTETQLIYCFNLASLNIYDSSVLEKVFNSDLTPLSKKTHWTSLKLWQKLQTIPNYDGPKPSSKLLEIHQKLIDNFKVPFCSIEKAVNGPQYFKTNLKSKLLHQLDYVLMYKKGNDPSPQIIDQDVEFVEDLIVPDDCQIVIIVFLPSQLFTRNTDQVLGPHLASYDYLTSQSYKLVPISQQLWLNSTEFYRGSYLTNVIKSYL